MFQQIKNMLTLQDYMNTKVHPQWIKQGYPQYRAIWVECAELMDHIGYKWWKTQQINLAQAQLEIVDIWHFALSDLLETNGGVEMSDQIAIKVAWTLENYQPTTVYNPDLKANKEAILQAVEAVALEHLLTKKTSVTKCWDLMHVVGFDFDELYRKYIGKNVLNVFRQNHGYNSGTYIKQWSGREDNEHLVDILNSLDSKSVEFRELIYKQLDKLYHFNLETERCV